MREHDSKVGNIATGLHQQVWIDRVCRGAILAGLLISVQGVCRAVDLGPMLSAFVPDSGVDNAWSVFVGKDFEIRDNVAELEGRAFVRGNFLANKSNYVIGRAGGGSGVYPSLSVPVLVVGGNMAGSGGINTPKNPPIQVGSNIAKTVSFIDRGAVITGGIDYAAADALIADLHAKSTYWGTLPNTPGGSITSQWGGLYIAADGQNGNPKTWVFNLTNDVDSSYWGVELSGFEDGDTILINCRKAATNATFTLGVNSYTINGKTEKSPFLPKLIWNFPDVKTVTISGSAAFLGSILVGNPASTTTVSVPGHDGRFVTCGSLIHAGSKGAEFHNYPFTGTLPDLPYAISGHVLDDSGHASGSGSQPLAGVTVQLYSDPNGDGNPADGVLLSTTLTAADGSYAFPSLSSGSYVVGVSALPGSGTNLCKVVALAGANSGGNDFIDNIDPSGAFYDTADGRIVPGGTITVEGVGALVQLDGQGGNYRFVSTNSAPTTLTIHVSPPPGYAVDTSRLPAGTLFDPSGMADPVVLGSDESATNSGYLTAWTAAANPYYLVFSLAPGDPVVMNNNIPLVRLPSLGGRAWHDANGNGIQDAGEAGVSNVTVRLLNATNGVMASTISATNGTYAFSSLQPGSYRVQFVAPTGGVFTAMNVGTNPTVDSDADVNTGLTALLSLTAGQAAPKLDAGLYCLGKIYGYGFIDKNANLVRDINDTAATNLLVMLWTNGVQIASTRMNAVGYYAFSGLAPATYEIRILCAANTLESVPTNGTEAASAERNRAVVAGSETAVITYTLTSSISGLQNGTQVSNSGLGGGEPLNAGFAGGVPMAAAVLIKAYATAEGVVAEFQTIDEAGGNDMVLYLYRDGKWVEVGRQPSVGEGNNTYRFIVPGLSAGDICSLKVVDDEGYSHTTYGLTVGSFTADLVMMDRSGMKLAWSSLPDRTYDVYWTDRLGGEWTLITTVRAVSSTTTVVLDVSQSPAGFFKIVMQP